MQKKLDYSVVYRNQLSTLKEKNFLELHVTVYTKIPKLTTYHISALSCPTLSGPMDCSPQAPLPMEFSRQEYWRGAPFPTPGDLPDPGIKLASLVSSALVGGFFTTSGTSKALLGIPLSQ